LQLFHQDTGVDGKSKGTDSLDISADVLPSADALRLGRAFARIVASQVRQSLIELTERIALAEQQEGLRH